MRSSFRLPVLVAIFFISILLFPYTQLFAQTKRMGVPFSKEWLSKEAERLSLKPYRPPTDALPVWLQNLGWDKYQSIRFRPEKELWKKDNLPFRIQFFHLGLYFHYPVGIWEVENGKAHPIRFSKSMFTYGKGVNPPAQTGDLGFAGFRVLAYSDLKRDFCAFLGASYFRAVGASKQYGLSTRGIAIDTGMDPPEEFPRFKTFWLERPAKAANTLLVHALLDGPSLTGAYNFAIMPDRNGRTVMIIEAHLFPRHAIERIGIAPLTSMYFYGENDRRMSDDFRPEIHDSDGLELWTGNGEWVWRPLFNPPFVLVNSFVDQTPRGFGLLQRDRNFDHYQDDGAFYDERPSAWVEPLGDWGKGAVQLVELPTADETFDNIVAFWNPAEPVRPGKEMTFRYRLYWGAQPPVRSPAGKVIATRTGIGGIPGQKNPIKSRKFVIDFKGGKLSHLTLKDNVEPIITVSSGKIINPGAHPVREWRGWRVNFDLAAEGTATVDLRCYLRGQDGGALTETWLYQWIPPQ
jgi:glucans biosynthesis protein